MVLSNYWKAFKLTTIFDCVSSASFIDLGLVDIAGNRVSSVLYRIESRYKTFVEWNARLREIDEIRIGTGNGQVSPSDYCLFNDVTSSIGNLGYTITHSTLDNKFSSIINVSGINNSESDIVISELGITKRFITNTDATKSNPIMLAKVILNNPVTVPPSGAFAFTIEWDEA